MPMYDPVHDVIMDNAPGVPEQTTKTTPAAATKAEDSELETLDASSSSSSIPPTNEATEKHKPVILKHKLGENNRLTPSKKKQKTLVGPIGKSQNILSSARSRHLKKNDGEPFWRKDIQYELLKALFDDDTKAFTDPYADSIDDINMKDRTKDTVNHKLSFAELYIKTIAHSSKCSKILKDRLLNEMQMSIPTCMICLLVNVGRMNTTINFVPDMKSQLRTYHSIPSLQVNYSDKNHENKNDKQLQDTPRLKSILKACCDEGEEPNGLPSLESVQGKTPRTNVINLIFILCNAEESVNMRYFEKTAYKFYDLFLNSRYNPYDRSKLFLWLLYNYLETNLSKEEVAQNPFGSKIVTLNPVEEAKFDIDTEEELIRGKSLLEQRIKFLKDDNDLYGHDDEKKSSPMKGKSRGKSSKEEDPVPTTIATAVTSPPSSSSSAVTGLVVVQHSAQDQPEKTTIKETSLQPTTVPPPAALAPPALVMRQDIDVDKILNFVDKFRHQNYNHRTKRGLIKHEHLRLMKELQGPEDLTRLRLKNYKGDFGEYTSKMNVLFKQLKEDYLGEAEKDTKEPSQDAQIIFSEGDLSIKDFSL